MEKPKNFKELIEQGYAFPALLPEKNDYILSDKGKEYRKNLLSGSGEKLNIENKLSLLNLKKLDDLVGYTVPLISHDYGAQTPIMWNTLYEKLGLNIRNIMVVADPENAKLILGAFREDPKYLGGGLGRGFKEAWYSKRKKGGIRSMYLNEIRPNNLKAVNIVVKNEGILIGYNTDAQGFVSSLDDKFHEIGKKLEGSNIIIFGAGGVAKEIAYSLARKKVKRMVILNRTYQKAVALAYGLNDEFGQIAVGAGEDIIRGYLLNSFNRPDAAINLTDKGSDGPFENFAAFADARNEEYNLSTSRTIARELKNLNPGIIIADIVLLKKGKPITLRIAENEKLENLLDGKPMVINQAAPAYCYVQNANPKLHVKKVTEQEALDIFKKAVSQEK